MTGAAGDFARGYGERSDSGEPPPATPPPPAAPAVECHPSLVSGNDSSRTFSKRSSTGLQTEPQTGLQGGLHPVVRPAGLQADCPPAAPPAAPLGECGCASNGTIGAVSGSDVASSGFARPVETSVAAGSAASSTGGGGTGGGGKLGGLPPGLPPNLPPRWPPRWPPSRPPDLPPNLPPSRSASRPAVLLWRHTRGRRRQCAAQRGCRRHHLHLHHRLRLRLRLCSHRHLRRCSHRLPLRRLLPRLRALGRLRPPPHGSTKDAARTHARAQWFRPKCPAHPQPMRACWRRR